MATVYNVYIYIYILYWVYSTGPVHASDARGARGVPPLAPAIVARQTPTDQKKLGCGLMGSTLMGSKYLFDGFEQVLKIHVWDMTEFCMQPSPSRRNNNCGSQPMRTMLGKQRCMPYACTRWFPCVRRCMDMYGYMFMDECLHTQSQTRAHTYM